MTQVAPDTHRVRLPAPVVTPDAADRIKLAAQAEGRSLSNLIARAATLYADHVLFTRTPRQQED